MPEQTQASLLASNKLDSVSFDALLTRQDPFHGPDSRFDLRGVRMITPAALVDLAAACYALDRGGRRPTIAVDDPEVRSYLLRSSFVAVVAPVAQLDPVAPGLIVDLNDTLRGSNPLLIEVTKLNSGAALRGLLDRVVSVLCNKLRYDRREAFDLATAISEVSQNTFEHNREVCGFFAMQVYGSGEKRFLEIGIADYGDGLAATLSRNAKNRPVFPDGAAIAQATKLSVSAFDDPTHGTGLYHLLRITAKHHGMVQIRSGSAKVRYRMDQHKRWELSVPHMPGVQVALALPAKELANFKPAESHG